MRGSWTSGLDDAGARDLARDLVRYFAAFEGDGAKEGRDVVETWRHLLDDSSTNRGQAWALVERARRLPAGSAATELQLGLTAWLRQRWGGPFEFGIWITGHGWCEAFVGQETQWLRPTASYLSDAPRALIRAVTAVVEGKSPVACVWEEEPGETFWCFERVDDLADLSVVWRGNWSKTPSDADNWFTPSADEFEAGELRLRIRAEIQTLGSAVADAYEKLGRELGRVEYENRWSKPFPDAELSSLQLAVSKDRRAG